MGMPTRILLGTNFVPADNGIEAMTGVITHRSTMVDV